MENSLKQRIVGAVVLIALAVIFLPSMLKQKTSTESFKTQIPPKPITLVNHEISDDDQQKNKQVQNKLDKAEQDAALRKSKSESSDTGDLALLDTETASETKNDSKSSNTQQTSNSQKAKAEPKKQDVQKSRTVAKKENSKANTTAFTKPAWVMQVASFSNRDNANKLVDSLKASKYKAYRRDAKTSGGKAIYRIYVGPYIEKAGANKDLAAVSKISGSQAMLLAFDPIKH